MGFVAHFERWSKRTSSGLRLSSLDRLVCAYLSGSLSISRMLLCKQIFLLFCSDRSVKVRSRLSFLLSPLDSVPRSIILHLASDIPDVSRHIYARSPVLSDTELVSAIKSSATRGATSGATSGVAIRCAIASRSFLSLSVLRTIIYEGCYSSVLILLERSDIVLGPRFCHDIAHRYGDNSKVRNFLLSHCKLAPATRQLLVSHFSRSLSDYAISRGWTNSDTFPSFTQDCSHRASLDLIPTCQADILTYVQHLLDTDYLTPALLLRSICCGKLSFLCTSLSLLSDLSISRIRSILFCAPSFVVETLFRRCEFPSNSISIFHDAMFLLRTKELFQYADAHSHPSLHLSQEDLDSLIDSLAPLDNLDASLVSLLQTIRNERATDDAHTILRHVA